MSTLTPFDMVLAMLVGLLVIGALIYLAYRHRTLATPLMVGLTGAAVLVALAALFVGAAQAGGNEEPHRPASRPPATGR